MARRSLLILFFVFGFSAIYSQTHEVLISTNLGNMKFMLYDDTPRHRDGFLELVNSGHFNGTLFYRVIKGFMIQGGSKDSRNAPPGKFIGYGDPTKTVDDDTCPSYL
jgi:cyclophilin family peptidyl-prolyl cis-trans isomerase